MGRIFVGNLSSSVEENELCEKFKRFGDIKNVDIRNKLDFEGNILHKFAFLDIDISEGNLINCIKIYNNTKWKGSEITVQVAKESYIQRIQREARNLQATGNKTQDNRTFQSQSRTDLKTENLSKGKQSEAHSPLKITDVRKALVNLAHEDNSNVQIQYRKRFKFDEDAEKEINDEINKDSFSKSTLREKNLPSLNKGSHFRNKKSFGIERDDGRSAAGTMMFGGFQSTLKKYDSYNEDEERERYGTLRTINISKQNIPQHKKSLNKNDAKAESEDVVDFLETYSDGNESAGSADTDEILSRKKNKFSADNTRKNLNFSLKNSSSVRNVSSKITDEFTGVKSFLFSDSLEEGNSSGSGVISSSQEDASVSQISKSKHLKDTVKTNDGFKNCNQHTENALKYNVSPDTESIQRSSQRKGTKISAIGQETEEKHLRDNEKRLLSLKERKVATKSKQIMIQSALSSIESGKRINKRIVFEDDNSGKEFLLKEPDVSSEIKKPRKSLFGENDEDFTENSEEESNMEEEFRPKPQFEGKKGQKMLELQAKFANDERFRIDERFIESDMEEEEDIQGKTSIMEEKNRNLSILQDMLGVPMEPNTESKSKAKYFRDAASLRFDPTSKESSKLELKKTKSEPKSFRKIPEMKVEEPAPQVSSERFYEVSDNLTHYLHPEGRQHGFSFMRMFEKEKGELIETDAQQQKYRETETVKAIEKTSKKTNLWEKNPFHYDSSEEECDEDKFDKSEIHSESIDRKIITSFFFTPKDPRFKETMNCFKRLEKPEEIHALWRARREAIFPVLSARKRTARRNFNKKAGAGHIKDIRPLRRNKIRMRR